MRPVNDVADLPFFSLVQLHGVMNCYIHSANAMMAAKTQGRIIGACSIVGYKCVNCRLRAALHRRHRANVHLFVQTLPTAYTLFCLEVGGKRFHPRVCNGMG